MRLLTTLLIYLCATANAADWPQLQCNARRTGYTPISVAPNSTAKWVWVDEDHVTRPFVSKPNQSIKYPDLRKVILAGDTQPIVADNKVYFGAANGEVYALNGADASTAWKATLGGPVLHTAAYSDGVVVFPCMDGKLYAFDAKSGKPAWTFAASAGFSVAPCIDNKIVFAGSRDGTFYAIDLATGALKWKYRTIAKDENDPFSGAPIVQSAASDGECVYFGAENMYFYALDCATGAERWRKPLTGSSFQYSWPVIHGEGAKRIVMTFVMVPDGHSEYVMEKELEALPAKNAGESPIQYAERVWPTERETIRKFLATNPKYRNFFVMRASDGSYPFAEEVPMGRVGGIGYPNRAPVIDGSGRILLHWRVRSGTLLTGGSFGTKFSPDVSAMDPNTGDRVWLTPTGKQVQGVELDNTFVQTVGDNTLYWQNHMRRARAFDLTTGSGVRLTAALANWDGSGARGYGTKLVWIGNDGDPLSTKSMPPPSQHRSPQGDCGVVIAHINGVPTMFLQESGHYQINFGCLAAVE